MKRILLLFLICFSFKSYGQTPLPIYLTPAEVLQLASYTPPNLNKSGPVLTSPPATAVRTMAEWEEAQALTITWTGFPAILREIVRYAQPEVDVVIICTDSLNVKNYLSGFGIANTGLKFIQKPFNSIWIRDYGQHSVYANEVDSLLLIDWVYNRPRPLDDQIPQWVSDLYNIPLHATTLAPTDLVNTGGNFMSDGMGTGFASELVLDENALGNPYNVSSKTEQQIDDIMNNFMGIQRYIKMTNLPYDGIHHIDMHMKLLDEETILVGQYPNGVADGPQIEANIQYIKSNFLTPFGTPYRFVRIPMPPDQFNRYPDANGYYRTYTNSIFINKTILVPTYHPQYDTTALRIYRENLPGYNVVGINCNQIIPLSGALHCITKLVGASEPLRIVHEPYRDTLASFSSYTVQATIQHKSGIAGAKVYYTTDTLQGFQSIDMTATSNNTWTGAISPQFNGAFTEVFYYIEATANNGKVMNRPMPAPSGFWNFWAENTVTTFPKKVIRLAIGKAFPNPSTGRLSVSLVAEQSIPFQINLYNMNGQLVRTLFEGKSTKGSEDYFFDLEGLAKGAYLLHLRTEEEHQVQKILLH